MNDSYLLRVRWDAVQLHIFVATGPEEGREKNTGEEKRQRTTGQMEYKHWFG